MSRVKKKQENRAYLVIVVLLSAALAVGVAGIVMLSGNANDNTPQTAPVATVPATTVPAATVPAATETTADTEPTAEVTLPTEVVIEPPVIRDYVVVELVDGQIQTPYGVLHYPEGLADHLIIANTSQQPYTLEFYAVLEDKEDLRLFDVSLGEGSGGNMGVVIMEGAEIPVSVTIYTLITDDTWTSGEVATVYAMQDAVNDLLDQLTFKSEETEPDVPVVTPQPDNSGTINNLQIETPYCTLYYPARFADTVRYDIDESHEEIYKVHFYSQIDGREDQLLFSIYFGGDEGEQLGVVMSSNGTPAPVYLVVSALNLDGWDEAEMKILYSMQEACNELIERLPLLDL